MSAEKAVGGRDKPHRTSRDFARREGGPWTHAQIVWQEFIDDANGLSSMPSPHKTCREKSKVFRTNKICLAVHMICAPCQRLQPRQIARPASPARPPCLPRQLAPPVGPMCAAAPLVHDGAAV